MGTYILFGVVVGACLGGYMLHIAKTDLGAIFGLIAGVGAVFIWPLVTVAFLMTAGLALLGVDPL